MAPCRQPTRGGHAQNGTKSALAQARGEAGLAALLTRLLVLAAALAFACLQFSSEARAQEAAPISPFDAIGDLGLAGMLAGLLVFALVALWNHHRTKGNSGERVAALEAALEARDDKIWALEERLANANEFVDAQGDVVLRQDADGRVTHASVAAAALIGKKPSDIVGQTLTFRVVAQSERATLADGSISYDQEIHTKDGPRWIAWKEAAVRDDLGRIKELQRVGRDVSARVATERALADARTKAEAANRAKSRFLAVISHEVRTPLNGILGMTGLLLDTQLSPEQRTYAQAVKTSGQALLGLIEEVLDFSKIEAGRLDLESVPFDLVSLVTVVVELIAPHAQEKGIEIAADFDDRLPRRVTGDAARLRQVLLNLAGNAVKFTDHGGVAVVVEREDGDRIRFWVSDSGPGIGADAQARIFKEFEQGDSIRPPPWRHRPGLAIAARIVEKMGGEIQLESSTDEGSNFTFVIELPEVADANAMQKAPDLKGLEILVASPSPVIGPLLVRRLNAWHAKVVIAPEAAIAKAILPEREWAAVIIDRAFGLEATAELARLGQDHAEHRHVLLGPAERGELATLREAGFDGYLVKPVRAATLAARLTAPELAPPLVPQNGAEADAEMPGGRRLAILVAEDNQINALLAQAMLARLGHAPTVVSDGVSALTAVATAHAMGAPYDLVLMDLHLPGMDGLEATQKIRALAATEGGTIPIVALTANAAVEDHQACREAGMDAFLVKPIDRERLDQIIAETCGTRPGALVVHAA
jgi:signal transduction histidine kinase/CheY-like chemotaxis protein